MKLLIKREAILSEAMKEFAQELQMGDPADLIAYIKLERYANLNDVIQSAMELYFDPEKLRFGFGGECHLEWGELPRVSLDMEFADEEVNVQFQVLLGTDKCDVSMNSIMFANVSDDVDANTDTLSRALNKSMLPKR